MGVEMGNDGPVKPRKTDLIPRIMGKVGQAESPDPRFDKKWFFKMWMVAMGAGEPTDEDSMGEFGPYDTEEQAHAELKRAVQVACEAAEKAITGKTSGLFVNMKNNKTESWE